jgi:methionyl-tRNA synthetase
MQRRRILVTSALPYANGPLHLGHMLEQVQTDIWVRFQRSRGHECHYICADDAHGTAIMLSAESQGITPEEQIDAMRAAHLRDSDAFAISFDNFGSTHSDATRVWCERIYERLRAADAIAEREITQAYDPEKGPVPGGPLYQGHLPALQDTGPVRRQLRGLRRHLHAGGPDRPRLGTVRCVPRGETVRHLFFRLPLFADMLRGWIDSGTLQEAVANKLREWTDGGLQEWDISRDAPYFGFPIPGEADKYFYVWLDAPIGYMGSFREYCDREGVDFDAFWQPGADTELYHFIGKDIINFHGLFWPAMLHAAAAAHAQRRLRARVPDRERHQDVEKPRHLYQRAPLPRAPRRRVPALLLRGEARRRRRRHRSQPG